MIDLALCSLGFPAYYEEVIVYDRLIVYIVHYGVITASHCGLRGDRVFQNVTADTNYIGYMRDEGRFDTTNVVNSTDVDATFIEVENYTYRPADPRPPPQVVSATIHYLGTTMPIGGCISSEQYLWIARTNNLLIRTAGRTSGYEGGYVRLCDIERVQVACNHPRFGWSLITTAYGAGGDSGGPAFYLYTVAIDGMKAYRAMVHGIQIGVATRSGVRIGEVVSHCIVSGSVALCMPSFFAISYNITDIRGVVPLTSEG